MLLITNAVPIIKRPMHTAVVELLLKHYIIQLDDIHVFGGD